MSGLNSIYESKLSRGKRGRAIGGACVVRHKGRRKKMGLTVPLKRKGRAVRSNECTLSSAFPSFESPGEQGAPRGLYA